MFASWTTQAESETPGGPKIPVLEEKQLRVLFAEFDEDGVRKRGRPQSI